MPMEKRRRRSGAKEALRLELIEDCAAWEALAGKWEELRERSGCRCPFLSMSWLRPWWVVYGRDRALFVVTAWEKDELVGVLPLFRERRREGGLVPAWRLEFLGASLGGGDFFEPLLRPDLAPQIAKALAAWLVERTDWDLLRLERLEGSSRNLAFFLAACRDLRRTRALGYVYPVLTLPPTADGLGRRQAAEVDWAGAGLRFRCDVGEVPDAAELEAALAALPGLHRAMVADRPGPHAFTDGDKPEFYRQVAKRLAATGRLCLSTLARDRDILAVEFGLLDGPTYYVLEFGQAPEALPPGGGEAFRLAVCRALVGRVERMVSVAFDDPLALAWCDGLRPTLTVSLYRAGKGRFLLGLKSLLAVGRALVARRGGGV